MFKYPLTKDELFENSALNLSKEEFYAELSALLQNGLLKEEGQFVLGPERTRSDITKRLLGNSAARRIMPFAYRYAKKIAGFPFVEGVCLSGGLSKNYFDKQGDIDYFIVTRPGRLWICRSLLILRYKMMPRSLKKFWCVNYFISSDKLQIPDINAFTSTELAYLIPAVNYESYKNVIGQNSWYKTRFPNKKEAGPENCIPAPSTFFKRSLERLLGGALGEWLDNSLLKYTLRRWRKKFSHMREEDFELQFRSKKDVCKRHTHGFQNKVLVLWNEKLRNFGQAYRLSLTDEK